MFIHFIDQYIFLGKNQYLKTTFSKIHIYILYVHVFMLESIGLKFDGIGFFLSGHRTSFFHFQSGKRGLEIHIGYIVILSCFREGTLD